MNEKTYRVCQNCGTLNLNNDYCTKCGEVINIHLKRKLERKQKTLTSKAALSPKQKNKITVFFESVKNHKNPLIRYAAKFVYSIWFIVLSVGAILALATLYIAA